MTSEWQELIQKKRAARDALIPQEWRLPTTITSKVSPESTYSAFDLLKEAALLTDRENDITENNTATSLTAKIASGELSSYDVAAAFCKRAALVHQLTNSLTEIFFDKALERARWLDEYFAKEGKTVGPFHGLPITLKDMVHIKGEHSTMGFVGHLKYPAADEHAVIAEMLEAAGAVFYCKTNVPQTLFVCESFNNVFGRTLNPYKLCLSPGGSSSGEAAQIGLRGSIMGVGSDIAGSVRVPALFTGVYGFRPTVNRLPWAKQADLASKGWQGVQPTLGPIAHTAQDLTLFMKTVIQAQPWRYDSTALAVPWHDAPREEKLTIGVWSQDPEFPVYPPIARCIASAVDKLRAAGHTIKVIEAPPTMKAMKIAMRWFALDQVNLPFKFLEDGGEQPIADLAAMDPGQFLDPGYVPDLHENIRISADIHDYRDEWAKIWRDADLDVLLCPASRGSAVPHGEFGPLMYTILWNLLDFPSSVVPFGKVNKIVDSKDGYDASVVDGAPTGFQLVGWRFQDEQTLMATEVIADALKA
ncbi:amidase [Stachybotrys elegans]|uniref:amidase n=1 Tax=Stachybotrys elegans TaxID=80388 RepID=A0A8K0SWY2_9HYPO|nr:amidase [Stachybotrys elegans]